MNVVGIIKVLRLEGNEVVVLVIFFILEYGRLFFVDKLILLFGMVLFEFYGSLNWLVRDVIWIMVDVCYGFYIVVVIWFEEYYELKFCMEEVVYLY